MSGVDITNTALIRASLLYQYNNSVDNFRCPGDKINGGNGFRARSYSLNCMMEYNGGNVIDVHGVPGSPNYIQENLKLSSIRAPGPSSASFFVDEQASPSPLPINSIVDDGYYVVNFPDKGQTWRNVPASRHGNHGQFSFADGHAGIMKWVNAKTQYLMGHGASSGSFTDQDLHQIWSSTYPDGGYPGNPGPW